MTIQCKATNKLNRKDNILAHIQVIIGSTRPSRVGKKVADWFLSNASVPNGSTIEIIDLKDVNLPMLDEPVSAMNHQYSKDHTKAWSEIVSKADGYVWVTPEYNHGVPASLKNAIDYLYDEWKYKPVAFVGYGGMGGARAIEHLVGVSSELSMFPLKTRYHVIDVWSAFDEKGNIKPENIKGNAAAVIEEVVKVAEATKSLRI